MLYFNKRKVNCTGCTACKTVCPVACIEMCEDEEGFLYPVSSDACIHCGKCERICPIICSDNRRVNADKFVQKAYCARTKDIRLWQSSASGGAFSEICMAFGDEKTRIYGAAWNGLRVAHIGVEGCREIAPLRKSKYVESALADTFLNIKTDLAAGKKVIFCGTPCQVAGLRQVLGENTQNILFIDLICHGVGSPQVFETATSLIGEQFASSVKQYEFRAKRAFHETDHLTKVSFASKKDIYLTADPYMQLFLKQDCLRPSCGKNCRFRTEQRQGDLTIADFKNLKKVFPELAGEKYNYSTIVANTEKAEQVIRQVSGTMEIRECSIEDVKKNNPLFYRQTVFSETRDAFFEDFVHSKKQAIESRTVPAQVYRGSKMRTLAAYLPRFIRKIFIKAIQKRGSS